MYVCLFAPVNGYRWTILPERGRSQFGDAGHQAEARRTDCRRRLGPIRSERRNRGTLQEDFLNGARRFSLSFAAAKPLQELDNLPITERWPPFYLEGRASLFGIPERYWKTLLGKPAGQLFPMIKNYWLKFDGHGWEGVFFDDGITEWLSVAESQASF
jgi:hypothetical protein